MSAFVNTVIGASCFLFTLFVLCHVLNIPAPFTKTWIQNNTEESLQWILEAKNDND